MYTDWGYYKCSWCDGFGSIVKEKKIKCIGKKELRRFIKRPITFNSPDEPIRVVEIIPEEEFCELCGMLDSLRYITVDEETIPVCNACENVFKQVEKRKKPRKGISVMKVIVPFGFIVGIMTLVIFGITFITPIYFLSLSIFIGNAPSRLFVRR